MTEAVLFFAVPRLGVAVVWVLDFEAVFVFVVVADFAVELDLGGALVLAMGYPSPQRGRSVRLPRNSSTTIQRF